MFIFGTLYQKRAAVSGAMKREVLNGRRRKSIKIFANANFLNGFFEFFNGDLSILDGSETDDCFVFVFLMIIYIFIYRQHY